MSWPHSPISFGSTCMPAPISLLTMALQACTGGWRPPVCSPGNTPQSCSPVSGAQSAAGRNAGSYFWCAAVALPRPLLCHLSAETVMSCGGRSQTAEEGPTEKDKAMHVSMWPDIMHNSVHHTALVCRCNLCGWRLLGCEAGACYQMAAARRPQHCAVWCLWQMRSAAALFRH